MRDKLTVRMIALMVVIVLIGVLSFTVAGKHFSQPEAYTKTIETLDEKKENVAALTASAAAISTGLAAVPGDATDPIANELADLSSTFMIIIAAILLEKYLLTLTGMLAFKILIPLACVLTIAYLWTNRQSLLKISTKLALFGLCLVLLVPTSTYVTNLVDATHQQAIEQNIAEANAMAEQLQDNTGDDGSFFDKSLGKFQNGLKGIINKAETHLSNFIDAAAMLLITSCGIPLLTLWVLMWLMKTILGIEIRVPADRLKSLGRSGSKARKRLTGCEDEKLIDGPK